MSNTRNNAIIEKLDAMPLSSYLILLSLTLFLASFVLLRDFDWILLLIALFGIGWKFLLGYKLSWKLFFLTSVIALSAFVANYHYRLGVLSIMIGILLTGALYQFYKLEDE